jgi:hypothetical protein
MTYAYTTQAQLRAAFWAQLPNASTYRKSKRQNEQPCDVRMAWCDFVEEMHRNGDISDTLAQRATL